MKIKDVKIECTTVFFLESEKLVWEKLRRRRKIQIPAADSETDLKPVLSDWIAANPNQSVKNGLLPFYNQLIEDLKSER